MQSIAFELTSQGGPLRGDVRFLGGAHRLPVVVVCHGFKGFKDWGFFPHVGDRLAAAGFLSVTFNFSGSGIGADPHEFTDLDRFAADTMSQQVADLGHVLDALEDGTIGADRADWTRCGVLGHSRGAAVALVRAREDRRLRALATWAGVSSLMRYTPEELDAWRLRGYMEFLNTRTGQQMRVNYTMVEDWYANRERFDLLAAASRLEAPLLIVHGSRDASVHVQEAHELHAAAGPGRSRLVLVPGAGHTFGAVHLWAGTTPALDEALSQTLDWFRIHLGPEPPPGIVP